MVNEDEMRVSKAMMQAWLPASIGLCGEGEEQILAHAWKRAAERRSTHGFAQVCDLDGQNRQSPIASVQRTRSTLAGHAADPCGTNVKRMNGNGAIRIAAQ